MQNPESYKYGNTSRARFACCTELPAAQLFALCALVVALCSPAAAAQAGAGYNGRLARTVIVLDPPQSQLAGPDSTRGPMVWSESHELAALLSDPKSRLVPDVSMRPGRDIIAPFDFGVAVTKSANSLDRDANWQAARVLLEAHPDKTRKSAHRMLAQTGADFLLYLKYTFFLTPQLDQIRLWVSLEAYARPTSNRPQDAAFVRHYEYLSPSTGVALRPFRDGEKEAVIAAIDNQYEQKLAKFPNNKKAYGKDRRNALKAIKDRDTILPLVAVNEAWPGRTFADGLQMAANNLTAVIRNDLRDIYRAVPVPNELTTIRGFDTTGKEKVISAMIIDTLDSQTVYRDADGNLYSMP